jgi:hypothetical protein
MALTLLEASKHASNAAEMAVIRELTEGDILSVLPFNNISGSGVHFRREESLAGVGFRHLNQGLTESYGQTSQQSEALKFFGGDVVVDRAIIETQGEEARAYQVQSKIRAMRMVWERVFIKGSEAASNGLEFDGLEKRCGVAGQTSQAILNPTAGSSGLSLAALDELIDEVDVQGAQPMLIMSKAMRRRLTQASRDGVLNGGIQISTDEFGRQRFQYNDARILIVDRDEENSEILGANEPGGTSSIYCVAMGPTQVAGIQNGGISVRDLGESHDKPAYLTRVEWYTGCVVYNGRSVARLHGIDPSAAAQL